MSASPTASPFGFLPPAVERPALVALLERATLLYLALPNLIFALGWLRFPFALLATVALGAGCYLMAKETSRWRSQAWTPVLGPARLPIWLVPALLAVAAFWTWISGIGGYQFYTGDWDKHFALLKSLQLDSWPPAEHPAGRDHNWPICYYFAYYLVPALVGKLAGWKAALFALYAWTTLGVFLSLGWIALLAGKRPFLAALVFPFLGGLDWLAFTLWNGAAAPGREHLEWWAGWITWEYSSNQTLLSWVPQHALACWLAGGWIAHDWLEGRGLGRAGFLAGLMPLWAPLVFLGMIPFALMALVREWLWEGTPGQRGVTAALKALVTPQVLLRALRTPLSSLCLPLFHLVRERFAKCFTLINFLGIVPAGFAVLMLRDHVTPVPHGFYWEAPWVGAADWSRMAFFVFMEIGVFALFASEFYRPSLPRLRWLGVVSLVALVLIPNYNVGKFNDFAMRFSQPALFFAWILVLRSLLDPPRRGQRSGLVLVTLLGSFGALAGWVFATDTPGGRAPPEESQVSLIYGIEWPIAAQYHGDPGGFFFKHLARKPEVGKHVPVIPEPPGMWLSPQEAAAASGRD